VIRRACAHFGATISAIANVGYSTESADDAKLGEQHLREFQDNEKTLPTILTTSQKLSTGVDARNIRNIVLLRPIKSMIKFKQIIGRGTRTFDGKYFFTIYDFVKAYEHLNDPEWDGEPLPPDEPGPPRPPSEPPTTPPEPPDDGEDPPPAEKVVVKLADGKERRIRYVAATTYWSNDGRPITAQEFMDQLFGDLGGLVASEDELRAVWSDPDRREEFAQRLTEMGYDDERMEDMRRLIDAPNSDVFDVLAYIRFTLAPLARSERADAARSSGLGGYEPEMKQFLDYVLASYVANGVEELSIRKIRDFLRVRYGGTNDAKRILGPVRDIRTAFVDIQQHLFR
jgi:type I restriction enzyme R subunit